VTPIGISAEGLWEGLKSQRSAVRSLTRFDPSLWRSHIAAEVSDFVASDFMDRKRAKRLDLFGQFSVAAARMALDDAGLNMAAEDRERVGSMMGSALGGVGFAEKQCNEFLREGVRALEPALALMVFAGAASCNIAIEFGVQGPNSTNAMSCASGTIAIGDSFRQIRDGYADIMICGGSEAPLWPLCYGAFAIIRAMSARNDDPTTACRPFDRDRDGFVMGEGGAVLILEEWSRAVARGAKIYGEVVGYGLSNDAYHMTAPRPDGAQAAKSMMRALEDAGMATTDVDYVNAHGSSTPLNDTIETLALKRVFGDHASRLQVSGTKGYYGHSLGASGAIEAAVCALALAKDWLPPTVNLLNPDEGCDLDYIPGEGRPTRVETMLSNSFGFGGINASIVMRRPN